jgi:hypothetical protein
MALEYGEVARGEGGSMPVSKALSGSRVWLWGSSVGWGVSVCRERGGGGGVPGKRGLPGKRAAWSLPVALAPLPSPCGGVRGWGGAWQHFQGTLPGPGREGGGPRGECVCVPGPIIKAGKRKRGGPCWRP